MKKKGEKVKNKLNCNKIFLTNNKMESANIYLTLVIIGITIIAVKKLEFLNLNQS